MYNYMFDDMRYGAIGTPPTMGTGTGSIPIGTGTGSIPIGTGMGSIPIGTGMGSIPIGTGMGSIPIGTGMGSIPIGTGMGSIPIGTGVGNQTGGTIPGTNINIASLLKQYPRPTSPPPQTAVNLVNQLNSNPQLLQLVVQQRPKTLLQLTQIMQTGSSQSPYGGYDRGFCPIGWEIVFFNTGFGFAAELIFNIVPFFIPGVVVGFDQFFNLRIINNVIFEICL
ncbi:hypothetical protein [Metabacillus iocasae]|uniref:Uncharacterized protein n=1 Tax=Priestia iocasae TaxID=2291674 RepID=A0ABS2QVY8_9BACI|nr:hypothetical protein [Metabacillus iocasae]MBM7703107.1 hypothetical protein [Metabacillus iocasae]